MLDTLWHMRHSSLRSESVFISDSSRDKAVIARFSDDSICYEKEQIDGVIQNSRIAKSRHHSTGAW